MTRRPSELRQGHEYVLERLSPYIDNQLKPKERARVEGHLNACASCRDELHTLQWTRSLLRQAPAVPIPRSFVIREADLAPARTARRSVGRQRPAFALQWAATLVAILLVVVIASDLFFGTQRAAPGAQPEVAMLSVPASEEAVTVVVESETVVEAPTEQAVTEEAAEAAEAQAVTEEAAEAEGAPMKMVVPTPVGETPEPGETARPVQAMGGGSPITGTTMALPMKVEETPVKGAPAEGAPRMGLQGNAVPSGTPPEPPDVPMPEQLDAQQTVATPDIEEPSQTPPAETPLAMVPPPAAEVDEPVREPRTAEPPAQGILPGLLALLASVGWRVAEIGLGILLIGLIVAAIWRRRGT